ncbi:hypothetical protein MJT46_005097 [Ovis ammon polii x Ovis aries]|nr:hypothetical protein MJT46_005097 [Ovis ammon polii x Ovis aries]
MGLREDPHSSVKRSLGSPQPSQAPECSLCCPQPQPGSDADLSSKEEQLIPDDLFPPGFTAQQDDFQHSFFNIQAHYTLDHPRPFNIDSNSQITYFTDYSNPPATDATVTTRPPRPIIALTAALPPGPDTAISGKHPASSAVPALLLRSTVAGFVGNWAQAVADMATTRSAASAGPAAAMAAPLGMGHGRGHVG